MTTAAPSRALSDRGLRFIARFEGYRRYPYNDPAGHATIGYGHLLHLGNVTAADRGRYPNGLDVAQALELLRRDAAIAVRGVQQLVTRPLGSGQFDALCSFAFNCGVGGLAHSTLLRDVNRWIAKPPSTPEERRLASKTITADFLRWTHAGGVELPGLVRRRRDEARLYLQGDYGDT